MGIVVETSRGIRRAAELATGAVHDDARQDENHADDPEQVGDVLRAEPVVVGIGAGRRVNDHVHRAGRHHQQQADPGHGGKLAEFRDHSS
jgi:hypothetical protein